MLLWYFSLNVLKSTETLELANACRFTGYIRDNNLWI